MIVISANSANKFSIDVHHANLEYLILLKILYEKCKQNVPIADDHPMEQLRCSYDASLPNNWGSSISQWSLTSCIGGHAPRPKLITRTSTCVDGTFLFRWPHLQTPFIGIYSEEQYSPS